MRLSPTVVRRFLQLTPFANPATNRPPLGSSRPRLSAGPVVNILALRGMARVKEATGFRGETNGVGFRSGLGGVSDAIGMRSARTVFS